jgi:hypothetical protein
MAVGPLTRSDQPGVNSGAQVGTNPGSVHGQQTVAIIQRRVDDMGVLNRAIQVPGRAKRVDSIVAGYFFIDGNAVFARHTKRECRQDLVMARFATLLGVSVLLGTLEQRYCPGGRIANMVRGGLGRA